MHFIRSLVICVSFQLVASSDIESQQPLRPASHPKTSSSALDSSSPPWRHDLLSLHRSLVEIKSISGDEGSVGKYLVDYLTGRGYIAQLEGLPPRANTPGGKDRFNVIAWKGNTRRPKPRVLVTSHIDVVPPHIPYSISDEEPGPNTMIKGRGSVDAKGSVAAQIIAVEDLFDSDRVKGDEVMLLYVVGEEDMGDGMQFFSDHLHELHPPPKFEAVIFGEPTENKLACGHKGGVFCDLSASGVAGHSGYPWLGKSANELMVRALAKIISTDLGSTEEWGNTTVNIGVMDGGVAWNVIPAKSSAKIAARVAIGPENGGGHIVAARIQAILDDIDEEAFTLECLRGFGVIPCNCDVEGFDPIVVNYGTDIPHLKGDHTRYLYGPGSILVAHGERENLTLGDLETAVKGYQQLILHALKA